MFKEFRNALESECLDFCLPAQMSSFLAIASYLSRDKGIRLEFNGEEHLLTCHTLTIVDRMELADLTFKRVQGSGCRRFVEIYDDANVVHHARFKGETSLKFPKGFSEKFNFIIKLKDVVTSDNNRACFAIRAVKDDILGAPFEYMLDIGLFRDVLPLYERIPSSYKPAMPHIMGSKKLCAVIDKMDELAYRKGGYCFVPDEDCLWSLYFLAPRLLVSRKYTNLRYAYYGKMLVKLAGLFHMLDEETDSEIIGAKSFFHACNFASFAFRTIEYLDRC